MQKDPQTLLENFVKFHAERIRLKETNERVAFLADASASPSLPLDVEILSYRREDIINALDTRKKSVQWLIQQLDTYDEESQKLIGLKFPGGDAFAHVITYGTQKDRIVDN